jgi:FG-GAP repeat
VNDSWHQVGNTLTGEGSYDEFGISMAMSGNGSRVVVGSGQGYVSVFDEPTAAGSDWIQVGQDIANGDSGFGLSVAMSADGGSIVVGDPYWDIGAGIVYVFDEPAHFGPDYPDWGQFGLAIFGKPGEGFGWSAAISADGETVAAGAPRLANENGNDDSGIVRVFQRVWMDRSWEQIGNDILDDATGDYFDDVTENYFGYFGWSVAMSADGSRVAAGGMGSDGNTYENRGHVLVFHQPTGNGSSWIQIGTDILAQAEGDNFGKSVAMSANGSYVAVGAPFNDGNGVDSGLVRVFEYPGVAEPECPLVHCDFATLAVARYMSKAPQKQRILDACSIISVTAKKNGTRRNVNVFNSSNIRSTSWRG